MPVFNGTLFQVDEKEMMRYAGLPPGETGFPHEEIQAALREASALAAPRGIWQILPYDPDSGWLGDSDGMALSGASIQKHLSLSFSAAVLAVTAGPDIEEACGSHFKNGNYARGLLLDAAATAVTEHLADQLDAYLKNDARRSGQKATWRFSPGYGDWPVTQQADFCRLIQAGRIGIRATDHAMLTPRKSVTAIIGLSACTQAPVPARCAQCRLVSCPFREKSSPSQHPEHSL